VSYHDILQAFKDQCTGITAVIFCDQEGETIDYVSDVDSYHTQLLGAYHSEVMLRLHEISTQAGTLKQVDLRTGSALMSLWPIANDFYVVVLAKRGARLPAPAVRDITRALEAAL
jgi:predicted regulator of Ras-like GTPase activity (Roadblock/LC7/MglB family)